MRKLYAIHYVTMMEMIAVLIMLTIIAIKQDIPIVEEIQVILEIMIATAKTKMLNVITTEETVVIVHGLEMEIAMLQIISDLVEILMVVIVKTNLQKHFKMLL